MAERGASDWTVIAARKQTAGRGRYQRRWESPSDMGLWFSVILRLAVDINQLLLVNLTTVLAVRNFLEEKIKSFSGGQSLDVRVKWPNDVWVNQKKICGILLESYLHQEKVDYLITGIGININQEKADFPIELQEKAISLRMVTGLNWELKNLLLEFLSFYYHYLNGSLVQNFKGIVESYMEHMLFLNEEVKIELTNGQIRGVIQGIDSNGYLKLHTSEGEKIIVAGDIWEINTRGLI